MDVSSTLREARKRAGLTQAVLASRAGTSQATISAYESGRKTPSVATLDRLLTATGSHLTVERRRRPVIQPSKAQHECTGRKLVEVLELAEALPTRHDPDLRFPPLHRRSRAA